MTQPATTLIKAWNTMSRATRLRLSCGLILFMTVNACAQTTLIWSDEFDGSAVDSANWELQIGDGTAYGLPAGWGNNELQYYTDRPENCFVADGLLHVIARQESFAGYNYTSARLRSRNLQDFLYGKMEACIKVPAGQGLWPAFWMFPTDSVYGTWAASGELDIMETRNAADTIHGTIHFGGSWPANTFSGGTLTNGTNFSQDFHVYTVEWTPDVIRWFVDGALYHTESSDDWFSQAAPANDRAPFDQLFHFLINLAVGGNFPGPPNMSTALPKELLVDWIRVYQFDEGQFPFFGQAQSIPGQVEAETFDVGGEAIAYHDCDAANNGGAFRPGDSVDIEPSTEAGFNVGWMCANEWLEYTINVQQTGTYLVEVRVASETSGGSFLLRFDGLDKTGNISVPVTGGWQAWQTVTAVADLTAGGQIMRFENANSPDSYNVNHFRLTPLDPSDLDLSGSVDLADHQILVNCLNGPAQSNPPPGCSAQHFSRSDISNDGDVDAGDFAQLQTAIPD